MSYAQPEFRSRSCTRYRFRYSNCRACADACQFRAITLSDEGISLNEAECRNCALCSTACPTEALSAGNLPRIEMLKRTLAVKRVTFACALSQAEGDETVPCLGALDAVTLAILAANGTSVSLAGSHHCAACPYGERGASMLARNLDGVDVLRAAVGNERWAAITVVEPDPASSEDDGHDPSRRHLFRRFLARPAEAIALAPSPMERNLVPLKAVRFDRHIASIGRALLQRIFDGAQTEAPAVPRHPALPVGRIEMTKDGCNACEICARACPTGAMDVAETGVAWTLNFQFSRCVACGLCVEACQPKVLRLADTMCEVRGPSNAVPLHTLGKQRCTHCDRFFISVEPLELCPICQGDDDDFAAIFR